MIEQSRIEQEIIQGKAIAHKAEAVWRWDAPTGILRAKRRTKFFISKGGIDSESSILELGCGTGLFTDLVYQKTKAKIIAIDISNELLSVARSKYPHSEFKQMDAMNLEFNDDSFDVIFGSSVLHHLNYLTTLKEIYRTLKPGGRMVFAEPNMLNPHIFLQKKIPFLKNRAGDCPHETAFVRWKLKEEIKASGFEKVEVIPYDFLYPLIPDFSIPFINAVGRVFEKIPGIKEIAGSLVISAKK